MKARRKSTLQIFTHTSHTSKTLTHHKNHLKISSTSFIFTWPDVIVLSISHCLMCYQHFNVHVQEFKWSMFRTRNTRVMLIDLKKLNKVSFRVIQDNENMLCLALVPLWESVLQIQLLFTSGLSSKVRITEFTNSLYSISWRIRVKYSAYDLWLPTLPENKLFLVTGVLHSSFTPFT